MPTKPRNSTSRAVGAMVEALPLLRLLGPGPCSGAERRLARSWLGWSVWAGRAPRRLCVGLVRWRLAAAGSQRKKGVGPGPVWRRTGQALLVVVVMMGVVVVAVVVMVVMVVMVVVIELVAGSCVCPLCWTG